MGKLESKYGVKTVICILSGILIMTGCLFIWPIYQHSGNLSALSDTRTEKSVHIGLHVAMEPQLYELQLDTIKAGLQEGTLLRIKDQKESPLLLETNASYELHKEEGHWRIVFQTSGKQQFTLYCTLPVRIEGEGVTVIQQEGAHVVTVTRVGSYSPIDLYWSSS
ncbi:hypothetical protein [Paenibacillus taiwanensis]|uniref:hypothetical protein n=1 Tax=Paenibacillus taiwanensis TaxID=401638 RepID=UPI00048E488D|nr:hypothetical protein [Paenibacillus taiwanensis]